MGSILMTGVRCEDQMMIAAGAVVKADFHIPTNVVVAGNPAKIVKALSSDQRNQIHRGVETYRDLARRYKEAG
jgi:phenylacetic acid degradation protein